MKNSPENMKTAAIVLLGVCILVHAGVYYAAATRRDSGEWIYSTREGVPARTSRTSGVIEFAGTKGWHKLGEIR